MAYHLFKSSAPYPKSQRSDIPPPRLFMVPLIAAAVLGGSQPAANAITDPTDPPGPDTFCARAAVSDECDVFRLGTSYAFSMPGIADDLRFFPDGVLATSPEEARLTGVIEAQGDSTLRFSVEIDMSDPVTPAPLPLLQNLDSSCYFGEGDPINWTAFTTWSGELVGLPGSIFDGARYSITKRHETSNIQFGRSANDKNFNLGMAGELVYELIDNPNANPDLPVGPLDGIFNIDTDPTVSIQGIIPSCFPPAEPDLTGTWTGTIDCVGFDAEVNLSAKPVERFFSTAVLQIGRSTNLLDVGDQYSVRLTREAGNAQSFCAYAPNNPDSTTGGQGVLVEPKRQATRVHFKFEAETLKARELIADGLHGTQTCKWSFTRTSTDPPAVADACAPLRCFTANFCDDDALCGQGPNRIDIGETCTCKDGFVGGGVGDGACTSAP